MGSLLKGVKKGRYDVGFKKLSIESILDNISKVLYDSNQVKEIAAGFRKALDTSLYASTLFNGRFFSSDQMKEIRFGLEEGLDVTHYIRSLEKVAAGKYFKYSDEDLYFNSLQMEQIRIGLKEGIDVTKYTLPKEDGFYQTADEMKETRNALFMYKDFNEHVSSKKSFFGQTKKD